MALATPVQWVDIDLSFIPIPGSGDLPVKRNEEAIKASIRNLVLTGHYEVPFHSEQGSDVPGMLFSDFNPVTIAAMQDSIAQLIDTYEPRALLNSVQVVADPDNNYVTVVIVFTPINTNTPVTVTIPLQRTR